MRPYSNITPEDRMEMEKYAKEGKSIAEISRLLRINKNTLNSEFYKGGGKSDYNAEKRNKDVNSGSHRKKKPMLSPHERGLIEKYVKLNFSFAGIARLLMRSATAIRVEIEKNGGKRNYDAVKAQRLCEEQIQKTKELEISKIVTSKEKVIQIMNRLENLEKKTTNLEFQIEILVETIKTMKEKEHVRKNEKI